MACVSLLFLLICCCLVNYLSVKLNYFCKFDYIFCCVLFPHFVGYPIICLACMILVSSLVLLYGIVLVVSSHALILIRTLNCVYYIFILISWQLSFVVFPFSSGFKYLSDRFG